MRAVGDAMSSDVDAAEERSDPAKLVELLAVSMHKGCLPGKRIVRTVGERIVVYVRGSEHDPSLLIPIENELVKGRVADLGYTMLAWEKYPTVGYRGATAIAWEAPAGRSLDDAVADVRSVVQDVTGRALAA